jgi:formylglycine-generating enzyme required for sulfatase activity
MAIHEVTVGQFRQFIQETGHKMKAQSAAAGRLTDKAEFAGGTWVKPGFPQSDSHPVVSVSWEDAVAFCRWLSKKEGREYRLPTEAEWEYACRAGTTTRYHNGDDPESLVKVANVLDVTAKSKYPSWTSALSASDGYAHTSPVGSFQPNAFGLHDMHGNVWEWCQDWYDVEYYSKSPASDPPGPKTGDRRLFRGGCWY